MLECSPDELDANEVEAFNIFDSVENGFNTQKEPGTGSTLVGENAGNAKFTDESIEQAFILLATKPELLHSEIAECTGISEYTVDAISGLKVHKRLHSKYPELYQALLNRSTQRFAKAKTLKDLNKGYPPLISPEGIEYIVENCSQFSKTHNLNNAHVIQVLKGKEKQHKGWRIKQ